VRDLFGAIPPQQLSLNKEGGNDAENPFIQDNIDPANFSRPFVHSVRHGRRG
jgi:hypothetical protein